MNKVLVTGLAIGKESDVCQACNYNIEWIIKYPSVLLWADKIIVTTAIWDAISAGYIPGVTDEYPELSKMHSIDIRNC